MCTIVALHGVRSDFPLVLATNRDEFFARPSAGPMRILEQPVTVGGRDLKALGTWMGVTREGLFVGVTNQRTLRAPDPSKRSRGELVVHALERENARAIRGLLAGLDGRDFNSFNLMFGRAGDLFAAYGRDDQREIEVEPVPRGVHVLPNDRLDSSDFWKVGRAKEVLAGLTDMESLAWDELAQRLIGLLSDGTPAPLSVLPELPPDAPFDRPTLQLLSAVCVRTPAYGTRSSTIVALTPDSVGHYLFADGPPDQTAFRDVKDLFGT
ncbi:MAG: NRDE family protein [Myxococcales bacterium]